MDDLDALIAALPRLAEGQRPAPYPHAAEAANDGQDDLFELGGPGDAPRTPAEAVALGHQWDREDRFVGVGYCLRTVRELYGVGALYPDAETAWENADHPQPTRDTDSMPFGTPVWWTNGRYGHVAIVLRDGLCLTTDYVEAGQLGVARIAALGPWCGGTLRGWSWDVNNVAVWRPDEEPVEPDRWTLADRERLLRNALRRARANNNARREAGLTRWLRQVQQNRKDQ